MRDFFEAVIEDLHAGRESWRVLTLFSSIALAISAFYVWW